jgi:hypothetical protein
MPPGTAKRLTAAEKEALVKAANKAEKFFSGSKLTDDKRDQIFKIVAAFKNKKKPVVGKEAIALWAAKIDYAIVNGDRKTIGRLIKTPVGPEALPRQTALYDSNGGCSCGGGGGGPAGW